MLKRLGMLTAAGAIALLAAPALAIVLPPDPPKAKANRFFEKCDRNRDGVIDQQEFKLGMRQLNRQRQGPPRDGSGPSEPMMARQPGPPRGPQGPDGPGDELQQRIREAVHQALRRVLPQARERIQLALRERDVRLHREIKQMVRRAVRQAMGQAHGGPGMGFHQGPPSGSPPEGPAGFEFRGGPGMPGPGPMSPGAAFKQRGRMGGPPPQMCMRMRRQAFRDGERPGPGFERPWRGWGRGEMRERREEGPAMREGMGNQLEPREFGAGPGTPGGESDKYVTKREFKAAMQKIMERLDAVAGNQMRPESKGPRPDAAGPKPERQGRARRGALPQRPDPE
jgi:hypothetical protein